MLGKLAEVEKKFLELEQLLSSPEIAGKPDLLRKYSKEHKELSKIVAAYREFKQLKAHYDGNREIIAGGGDKDLAELAQEELPDLETKLAKGTEELRLLLLPKDPNDDKNTILEIRAGAGGDEAGIFAGELFRAYSRYAERRGYRMEIMSASDASAGGYKEVIAMVSGQGAFSRFKYERGVHRVQRVPQTEAQGRVHTSTITVAVLPEVDDVEIQINEKDLRVDVFRAGGHGGQSVNTTDSAVRMTHLPTGLVVSMQDEKSQIKNKEKALRVLKARLFEMEQEKRDNERRDDRRSQVGTGDRSEKIRTYNFPQSRVTDHRIGLTVHTIDWIMDGDLDQLIDALTTYYQAEALKNREVTNAA